MDMICVFLTYAVMIGTVSASVNAMTRGRGGRFRWLLVTGAFLSHAVCLYGYGWTTSVSTGDWCWLYFLSLALLVFGLAFSFSDGRRGRMIFLVLSYFAYMAIFVPIGNLFFSGTCLSLSVPNRLVVCWAVALFGNLAYVFLASRRVWRCGRETSWILPSFVVGLLTALLVVSGSWPVPLAAADRRSSFLVFALATLATVVAIIAFSQSKQEPSREVKTKGKRAKPERAKKVKTPASPQAGVIISASSCDGDEPDVSLQPPEATRTVLSVPTPPVRTVQSLPSGAETGEVLFARAREIPHREVPDFVSDGPYLEILRQSAEKGYAPALAKFGDYALRRGAWVEAYYWFSLAKRNGLENLETTMREIRMKWTAEGFPDQMENVNAMFTVDGGSIGRALLHIDTGYAAAPARAFLKECHPEFLTEK